MTHYTSKAHRREHHWFVQCDQVPGAMSTVSRLDQAAAHQREAIAFVLGDVDEVDVEVTVEPALPEEVASELAEVHRLRQAAEVAEQQATERWRKAARALRASRLTVRDIGQILGVSTSAPTNSPLSLTIGQPKTVEEECHHVFDLGHVHRIDVDEVVDQPFRGDGPDLLDLYVTDLVAPADVGRRIKYVMCPLANAPAVTGSLKAWPPVMKARVARRSPMAGLAH